MSETTIRYQVDGAIAQIVLNRPEVSNGFNVPMCLEVLDALEKASQDPQVRVVEFRAEGKVFSVGGDLVEMKRAVDANQVDSLVAIAEKVNDISFAMKRMEKVILMVVEGPVAGAAANFAAAADFVVASSKSKFIQAFVGVALAPDAGGQFLLSRAIGANRAAQLAMTGEALSAQEAHAMGLVYQVVEPEKVEKAVQQLEKKLLRTAPQSIAAIKALAWKSQYESWESYRQLELQLQEELAYKEDFKEGVRAHAERRRPQFEGK